MLVGSSELQCSRTHLNLLISSVTWQLYNIIIISFISDSRSIVHQIHKTIKNNNNNIHISQVFNNLH